MQHKERRVGDVVIVDLEGRAAIGAPGAAMREIVGKLLDRGDRFILLNMAGVSYVDSGGIGDLVVSFIRVMKHDGELKLLNLNDKHRDVLEMTHLIEVFRHFDDESTAVHSFDAT